jgi:hypothetical protein
MKTPMVLRCAVGLAGCVFLTVASFAEEQVFSETFEIEAPASGRSTQIRKPVRNTQVMGGDVKWTGRVNVVFDELNGHPVATNLAVGGGFIALPVLDPSGVLDLTWEVSRAARSAGLAAGFVADTRNTFFNSGQIWMVIRGDGFISAYFNGLEKIGTWKPGIDYTPSGGSFEKLGIRYDPATNTASGFANGRPLFENFDLRDFRPSPSVVMLHFHAPEAGGKYPFAIEEAVEGFAGITLQRLNPDR